MTLIISAIDFSKCSIHALEYAINLANVVESDIAMVWVDNSASSDTDTAKISREQRLEVKDEFENLVDKYQPALLSGKLTFKMRKGKIYQELANQARYDDASIIISGSHGVSGYEKFWIGSNAYKIVSYAPCPVITIRLDHPFKSTIDKIILPIDSTMETRQKVPFTVRMAKFFNSEVSIIAVYSTHVSAINRLVDSYVEQVVKFTHMHKVKFDLDSIQADNVATSLIRYAEEQKADLISIMTEQETSASNILLGPYAQQMINNSSIPVMTIRAREIMKVHSGY